MSENFLTRVSFAGVPHTLQHIANLSQATVSPLRPADICRIYWMLSRLTISYSFSINGVQVSRNIAATSSIMPRQRMISPATFYKSQYDSDLRTSYVVELDLSRVYFDPQATTNIGLRLNFQESDNFGLFNIGLSRIDGMSQIVSLINIFDKNIPAYLNYNPSLATSASLSNITTTMDFFTI